jgi:hypothetical protein
MPVGLPSPSEEGSENHLCLLHHLRTTIMAERMRREKTLMYGDLQTSWKILPTIQQRRIQIHDPSFLSSNTHPLSPDLKISCYTICSLSFQMKNLLFIVF